MPNNPDKKPAKKPVKKTDMPDKTKTPNKPNKKPVKKTDMSDKPVKKPNKPNKKPVKKPNKPDLIESDRFPLLKAPTFVRKDIYTGADIPIFI